MYSKGTGTKEDDREALKWLKESAHNGYRKAQLRLAYLLSKGEYVRKDVRAAQIWLERAKANKNDKSKQLADKEV